MAAIFCVKRRNNDEPLDALVVACKKQKTESEEAALSTVVKFAGTVKDPDENVIEHITKKLSKEELKTNFKQHIVNITDKVRKETKKASADNRFKVVNYFRSLDNSKTEDSDVEKITVINVEEASSCSTEQNDSEDKEDYVYDLYYTATEECELDIDSINAAFQDTRIFYTNAEECNCDDNSESENSNSESHWKNDYPDEHSEDSITEVVKNLKITDGKSDLSSEDEDFSYSIDENDEDYFGHKYAKFKANFKKEFENPDSDSSNNDSSESEGMGDLDE